MKKRTPALLWWTSFCHGGRFYDYHTSSSVEAFSTNPQFYSAGTRRQRRFQARYEGQDRSPLTALASATSSPSTTNESSKLGFLEPDFFLHQVETTLRNVLSQYPDTGSEDSKERQKEFLLSLDGRQRESFGVAQNLHQRLVGLRKNNDCGRCWMQRAQCICGHCPPLVNVLPQLDRIFLILHHKEVAMKVDTAKLILAAFPDKCRLVVAGIGPEYQASMKELEEAIQSNHQNCLVLFPDDNAQSLKEILSEDGQLPKSENESGGQGETTYQPYDLIVLDGTWAQARKIHSRYIPSDKLGGPRRVQLSQSAVESLQEADDQSGHQLRRHSTAWRQVGTYEATRLFIKDLEEALPEADCLAMSSKNMVDVSAKPVWKQIEGYQAIANEAARRELGPPRKSLRDHT